jgi:hypothetical protein
MTSVYQYRQLNGRRAANIHQGVHGRTYRASGEEHIINQDHVLAAYVEVNIGAADLGLPYLEVITVKGDIQGANGHLTARVGPYFPGQPVRKMNAATLNAHQAEFFYPFVALNYLVASAHQGAIDLFLIQQSFHVHDVGRAKKTPPPVFRVKAAVRLGML